MEKVKNERPGVSYVEDSNTVDVVTSGDTVLIESTMINGRRGNFTVTIPTTSETIVVFPRVSNDGTNWAEMDNGSGTSQIANTTKVYPFTGDYKYIKLDATASTKSDDVVATMFTVNI